MLELHKRHDVPLSGSRRGRRGGGVRGAAGDLTRSTAGEDFAHLLRRFYEKYNPEKASNAASLASQFAGQERALMGALQSKYEAAGDDAFTYPLPEPRAPESGTTQPSGDKDGQQGVVPVDSVPNSASAGLESVRKRASTALSSLRSSAADATAGLAAASSAAADSALRAGAELSSPLPRPLSAPAAHRSDPLPDAKPTLRAAYASVYADIARREVELARKSRALDSAVDSAARRCLREREGWKALAAEAEAVTESAATVAALRSGAAIPALCLLRLCVWSRRFFSLDTPAFAAAASTAPSRPPNASVRCC